MSKFADKLRSGGSPTKDDWLEHLLEVHRAQPGFTAQAFSELRAHDGKSTYDWLAATIPLGFNGSVLDLACGNGALTAHILARSSHKARVFALDLSREELALARDAIHDARAIWIEGLADRMPFADGDFDFVLCHLALMVMNPIAPVIAEIKRVLKPCGVVAGIVPAALDDDFMLLVQKHCMEFIAQQLPAYRTAETGDRRMGSAKGLAELLCDFENFSTREIHLKVSTSPEGVWKIIAAMYFVTLLAESERLVLRQKVIELAKRHAGAAREVHFELQMRSFQARLPAD